MLIHFYLNTAYTKATLLLCVCVCTSVCVCVPVCVPVCGLACLSNLTGAFPRHFVHSGTLATVTKATAAAGNPINTTFTGADETHLSSRFRFHCYVLFNISFLALFFCTRTFDFKTTTPFRIWDVNYVMGSFNAPDN